MVFLLCKTVGQEEKQLDTSSILQGAMGGILMSLNSPRPFPAHNGQAVRIQETWVGRIQI